MKENCAHAHPRAPSSDTGCSGVTPDLVRLSVGIEDVRDILADLDQALRVSGGASSKAAQQG